MYSVAKKPIINFANGDTLDNDDFLDNTEINKLCKLNHIPFFAAFAVANEDGNTKYENYTVMTGSEELNLYDDSFDF